MRIVKSAFALISHCRLERVRWQISNALLLVARQQLFPTRWQFCLRILIFFNFIFIFLFYFILLFFLVVFLCRCVCVCLLNVCIAIFETSVIFNCQQVREVIRPEDYARFEQLLLQFTLDSMRDVVYCPRRRCQSPVIVESDNRNMGRCPVCCLVFCTLCKRTYHGLTPCVVRSREYSAW